MGEYNQTLLRQLPLPEWKLTRTTSDKNTQFSAEIELK